MSYGHRIWIDPNIHYSQRLEQTGVRYVDNRWKFTGSVTCNSLHSGQDGENKVWKLTLLLRLLSSTQELGPVAARHKLLLLHWYHDQVSPSVQDGESVLSQCITIFTPILFIKTMEESAAHTRQAWSLELVRKYRSLTA